MGARGRVERDRSGEAEQSQSRIEREGALVAVVLEEVFEAEWLRGRIEHEGVLDAMELEEGLAPITIVTSGPGHNLCVRRRTTGALRTACTSRAE